MSFRQPLLVLLLAMPSIVHAEYFRSAPADAPGIVMELTSDSFLVEMPDELVPMQKICQRRLSPVSGSHIIYRGDWARTDLVVPNNGGAVARVEFFDADGQRVDDSGSRIVRPAVQGTHDWQDIDALVPVPEGAEQARACITLAGVEGGSFEIRGLGLETLPEGPGEGHNVLIVLIDTLRSDMLGAYGQALPLSPRMDAFADQSMVYDRAWTQYTWTVPSVISLFLSQYGRTHGWDSSARRVNEGDFTEMPLDVPTLAELLKERGYLTVSHRANTLTRHGIGLSRGFMVYDGVLHRRERDQDMLDLARSDIATWDSDGHPNFLYLHFMGPHTPLWPSPEGQAAAGVSVDYPEGGITGRDRGEDETEADYNERFRDAYMASILDIDVLFGELMDFLEETDHADDTLVFLTSDHGELLGEHGLLSHGNYVYEPLTAVPLILRAPDLEPQRVSSRVGQVIDIAPTIMEYLGFEDAIPDSWQGTSLLDTSPTELPAVSERQNLRATTMDGRYKIIEDRNDHGLHLAIDLLEDPGEENSLSESDPRISALISASRLWLERIPEGSQDEAPTVQMDQSEMEATQEALQALGYVE